MASQEVLHGTTIRRILEFTNPGSTQDLFGVRYPDNQPMSATLTDDISYASDCAIAAKTVDGQGYPIILHFTMPEEYLVNEGFVGNNRTILGYSTTFRVEDPHQLPDRFLQNLGITVEDAIRDFAAGEVEFYRVPREFFTHLDLL